MQPPYYPGDPSSMMGPPGQGMPPSGPDPYAMPQQQMPMPAGYNDAYNENVGHGGGGGGTWGYYGGKGGGRETTSATSDGAGTGQAREHHGEQSSSGYSGGWGGAATGMSWPRKGGGSKQEVREGDWFCNTCGDHQFARNEYCRSCYAAKGAPPPDPSSPEYLAAVAAAYWPMMGAYPGSAGTLVYHPSNTVVSLCRAGPDGAADPSTAMPAAYGGWPGWWGAGGKGKQGRREGDWDCPACGDMNFASRVVCRKCGAAPTYGSAMGAYGVGSMSNGIPSNLAATGASTDGGERSAARPRSRSRSRDRRF
ncbi:hypothetical protein FOZ62_001473 [Perkinsus olseni]|uniref:RanBP2-type domain-containing protein n=1 Tax=Perkinsus olseni TaxID=32597 RepID=A0A7J6QVS4_PEROL|nr:hypothetical protein FOZ62_001473 [Perkinsus olseni]